MATEYRIGRAANRGSPLIITKLLVPPSRPGTMLRPHLLSRLHRRAAGWFAVASSETPALLEEALRHAFAAQAYDLAADLIIPHFDQLGAQGRIDQLIDWLAALPEAVITARPALELRYAWVLFLHGRQDEAVRRLEAAEALLSRHPDPDPLTAALPYAIRAAIATTDHDNVAVAHYAEQAAAMLPPDEQYWATPVAIARGLAHLAHGDAREATLLLQQAADLSERTGNSYGVMIGNWHLGHTYIELGRLEEASRIFQHIAAADEPLYMGYREVGLAAVAYERDELADAGELARRGMEMIEAVAGQPRVIIFAQRLLACIAQAEGDLPAAEVALDRGEATARHFALYGELAEIAALRARCALRNGNRHAARAWALDAGLNPDTPDLRRERELLVFAEGLATRKQTTEALHIAVVVHRTALGQERIHTVIACEVLQALALTYAKRDSEAVATFAVVVERATATGLVRQIRNANPAVQALVARSKRSNDLESQSTGAAWPVVVDLGPPQEDIFHGELSAREVRVLGLIAAGCSNREIAGTLIVSVNTVKTHIKRIYEKLGVNSRVGAVERARALGMHINGKR